MKRSAVKSAPSFALRDDGQAPAGGSSAVSVRAVSHFYEGSDGSAVQALDDVSLDVPGGCFASLIGPSGCGKSTLLKIIGGLLRQTGGEAYVQGKLVAGPEQETGYMFQDATLLAWRTALDNVLLPMEVRHGRKGAKRLRGRAEEVLRLTGLWDFRSAYPHQLSGGMAQRVAISRMLVGDPALLLMDEPFGALDELTRDAMNEELQRVCMSSNATAMMVTHSIPEAVFLSDVVFVMSRRPATISHVIEVDLPRPRTLKGTATSPEYMGLVRRVRGALDEGNEAER
jgi:NitT/TauT family transport system ATP-binding protein